MAMIRFSIIITSYNQREYMKEAVDSALALRYAEKEIIVVDDGSTDGSQETLKRYGDAIRVVLLEKNRGHGTAANSGAALASGDYLVFLDGDDTFLPWALDVYERIVFAKRPKLILGSMWWFKGDLPVLQLGDTPQEIRSVEYQDYLRKDRPFRTSSSALVVDRQSFQAAQGWSIDLWPLNDGEIMLRLGDCGRTIHILAPPTTFHRAHATNTINNVPSFIPPLYQMIHNERAGMYPGGARRSWERQAIIGGMVVFWAKRAASVGFHVGALKLLLHGWRTVLAVITRKWGIVLKGQQPCESIKM